MDGELLQLMSSLDLGKFVDRFAEQDIHHISDLHMLTEGELDELLPTFGSRARLSKWMMANRPSVHQVQRAISAFSGHDDQL